jgi:methylmalonyl-CoA/ethylmalonyl-CoA epimerase
MGSPFHALHHICIVVHDISRAVENYESIGIGPWRDYPALTEYTTLSVPNRDAFFAMKYKVTDLDNVQLQLCEPPALDCPQRRFLDSRGEGVYHVGFETDIALAEAAATQRGLTVTARGQRTNGSGFLYFDTSDIASVVLVARKSPPSS